MRKKRSFLSQELHTKKKTNGWNPQVNEHHVVCPVCGNEDGEKICELRSMFFQCEKCGHLFDSEMSL